MNDTLKHVNNIRNWLQEKGLDALIIPHADEYLSEYLPPENERLKWATGFTGSAGLAVITDSKGAIFVDGRYTIQLKEQVNSSIYELLHIKESPWTKWIEQNLHSNAKIGYDPRLHQANWEENTKKLFKGDITLLPIEENPIDVFWENRPQPNKDKALLLDEKYTGKSSIEKRRSMAKEISKNKCNAAFITQLDSIAWLLNIRGNDVPCNPLLLCHGLLYADGTFELYINEDKIPKNFHNHVGRDVSVISPNSLTKKITKLSGKIIQLDSASSNDWSKRLLTDSKVIVVDKKDPCTLAKACKNDVEIKGMKECHIRDAIAECTFLSWFDEEITKGNLHNEGSLADKLDSLRSEQNNFKGLSFNTISAAGKNAAMCHYSHKNYEVPTTLEMNSVYLVDSGGQYIDGTTDITRTVAVGHPSDMMKQTFTLVLKGHIALSCAQFPEGIAGQHLDTLARQYLWQHGYDFDHGTGHGVGSYLNVHEGPHGIAKGYNNVPLREGMVVSNEPGYYRENEFGIRIENLIYVKVIKEIDGIKLLGFDNLTFVPIDKRLMDLSMLTKLEKNWINNYHKEVLKKIGIYLEGSALGWLKNASKPI